MVPPLKALIKDPDKALSEDLPVQDKCKLVNGFQRVFTMLCQDQIAQYSDPNLLMDRQPEVPRASASSNQSRGIEELLAELQGAGSSSATEHLARQRQRGGEEARGFS